MGSRRVRVPALLVLLFASGLAQAQPPDPTTLSPRAGPQGPDGQGTPDNQGIVVRPGQRPMRPPRDGTESKEPATASVRGRVTDENGQALRRATVTLFGRQSRQPRTALTDGDGRYEIAALPAGHYQANASKGGFVRLSYGQRAADGVGKPLDISVGQALEKIDFSLPRGGVITGRVVDELGEPVAEAHVTAMRFLTMEGRRRLMPTNRGGATDDLGQFRLYGLAPGEYYVSANAQAGFGGGFMVTAAGAGMVDQSPGYAPTFAPNTTSVTEATRFTVQAGQEVTTEIQLTASRLLRVTGTVVSANGQPATQGFVRLSAKGDLGAAGFGLGGPLGEGGAFVINHVPPGSYVLTVNSGFGGMRRRGGGRRDDSSDNEFASMPVALSTEDLLGVRLVTGRGLTVPGTVIAEGAPLPADPPMQVMALPTDGEFSMPAMGDGVGPDGRFELNGVFGSSRVQVFNLPRGWMVKSVLYSSAEVNDKPVEFTAEGGPLRIIITNRLTVITGGVSRDSAPITDYLVMVLPADPARWATAPGAQRAARTLRPNDQGIYRAEALPPGDYFVAAFDVTAFEAIGEETRTMPEFLERVRALGQRVELGDGQTVSVNLKLATVPQ